MADTKPSSTRPAAPKASRTKLLVVAAVVVLLAGGGGLAAYLGPTRLWSRATPEPAAGAAYQVRETGIISFEPFVVNLADAGGQRFLRISVRLVAPREDAERLQKDEVTVTRLRAELVELLSAQTADVVVTAEGKTALKKQILEHAARIARPAEVSDVLFSDFVVQF